MLLRNRALILRMLLIILCILYIAFMLMDLSIIEAFVSTSIVKYVSVILCYFISLLIGRVYLDKRDKLLLQVGLLITIISDFLLIFTDYNVLGVGVFSIAHIVYTARYKRNKTKTLLMKFTAIMILIISVYLTLDYMDVRVEVLFAVALFYAISLLVSVINALKACKDRLFPYPNNHLIAWGMVLFLLCDINVAFFNIYRLTSISSGIISHLHSISRPLIWLFYLPSQAFLSLSGYDFKKLHNNIE